jgi:2,4-dienoyl-CoA reductase-like NADH-dependent reductase (Old Yellow Enzyme family)
VGTHHVSREVDHTSVGKSLRNRCFVRRRPLPFELRALTLNRFLIAEGRIHTPEHARLAMEAGADAVVVGTAITHPQTITSWFTQAVETP